MVFPSLVLPQIAASRSSVRSPFALLLSSSSSPSSLPSPFSNVLFPLRQLSSLSLSSSRPSSLAPSPSYPPSLFHRPSLLPRSNLQRCFQSTHSAASQNIRPSSSSSSSENEANNSTPRSKRAEEPTAAKTEPGPSSSSSSLYQRLAKLIREKLQQQMVKASASNSKDPSNPTPVPAFPDLGRLISLALPQRRTIVIALVLLLVSSSISLTIPFAIGKVIDFFTSGQSSLFGLGFGTVAALMLLVFAVGAGAKAGSNILLELSGVRVVQGIRSQAYRSALRQDVEMADRGAGDTVSRLSVDTSIVGESLTSDIGDGLRAGVTVLFAGTAMFLLSSKLTLLMLTVVPPAAIGAVFYGRYLRDLTLKTQDAVGAMTRLAEERLSPPAFRTLTAFNTQKAEARRFDEKVGSIVELQTKEAYASGLFYAGTGFVGNCAILTLLTYGGHLVSKGEISVGDLTSLLMYTAYLGGGMVSLTSFFASVMKGVGAGARVFELIDRESNIKLGEGERLASATWQQGGPTRLPIRFNDVHFSYPSRPNQKILNGVSLSIEPGQSYALVGGSGAGKSSVHSLLLRYYDPSSGSISLAGKDLRSYSPESIRKQIAVVPQEPILFDGTLEENIKYGTEGATREEVERAAELAGCHAFVKDLSNGLDTKIGSRQLSGGQKQRVAIARALVKRPSILLLDEATSALDSASELLVNQAIDSIIREGKITVWIVAHRLSTIKSASNILVLDKGKIVEKGSFNELDRPGTRFRSLMAAQLDGGAADPVEEEVQVDVEQREEAAAAEEVQEKSRDENIYTRRLDGPTPARSSSPYNSLGSRREYHTSSRNPLEKDSEREGVVPTEPTWSVKQMLDRRSSSPPVVNRQTIQRLENSSSLRYLERDPSQGYQELERQLQDFVRLIQVVRDADLEILQGEEEEILDSRVLSKLESLENRLCFDEQGVEGIVESGQGEEVLDPQVLLGVAESDGREERVRRGYFVVERVSST
ncbi:hypothetical protein IE53DRAFT_390093 [Violaceomyces palustris]|uniref:Uncharacterized protein n=1 Tax=Violaceomyces palustris TaxID=1673888 RepID=A0ACD0NPK3_9BASI|nr:hypothetical protein IE53DRAFT_390093 [Violaceomyces palustris]